VIERMRELGLAEHARAIGKLLREHLHERLAGHPRVKEIRGLGLMIGVELVDSAIDVRDHALGQGVLINVTHDTVIRLLPPLIIDADQARQIADAVADGVCAGA